MRKLLIAAAILTFGSSVFAQKIKVRRVKGNQAVVDFAGTPLQPGQVYELMAQDDLGGDNGGMTGNSRRYVVGLDFAFYSVKSDVAGSKNVTTFDMTGRFGWNFGTIEAGPLLSYASTDESGYVQSTIKGGAFLDFNMIPNAPTEPFVYGVGGYLAAGQRDNGNGNKGSLVNVFAGPFVKWFPGGAAYAFRMDAGYSFTKVSQDSGDATLTGLGITAGLQAYF